MEQPVVAVCGVVPVAAIVPALPAGTCRHYRQTTTVRMLAKSLQCGLPNLVILFVLLFVAGVCVRVLVYAYMCTRQCQS